MGLIYTIGSFHANYTLRHLSLVLLVLIAGLQMPLFFSLFWVKAQSSKFVVRREIILERQFCGAYLVRS